VKRMIRQDERKLRKLRDRLSGESDPNTLVEILLALDRIVVELAMRTHNLPRRTRVIMREENRRLHDMLREHLPRFLELGRPL